MANEMRDRLVESMAKRFKELYKDGDWNFNEMLVGVADRLLDDGWIRPPCKVGDTVWILFAVEKTIEGREIASITQRNTSWTMTFTNGSCFTVWDNEDDEYFGKTVFLTKAEAEQKLKEMRGGNGNL